MKWSVSSIETEVSYTVPILLSSTRPTLPLWLITSCALEIVLLTYLFSDTGLLTAIIKVYMNHEKEATFPFSM